MEQNLPASFWRLWRSVAAANLADGVLRAVLPLLVVRYTTAPVVVAGVSTLASLPWILVLLVGVVVDRGDRRRMLALSGQSRAVVLVVAAAALSVEPSPTAAVVLLYVVALTAGLAETFAETSAGALIPTLAPAGLLHRANGRLQAARLVANNFLGPSVAGVVVAVGASLALGLPALAYLAAGLVALRLPASPVPRDAEVGWAASLREGAGFVARHGALRRLVVVTGLWNLGSGMSFAVLVLFAVRPGPLGLTEVQYGLLLAAGGVGGLMASALTERVLTAVSFRGLVAGALIAGSASLMSPALTNRTPLIAIALTAGGFASVAVGIAVVSLRQCLTPHGMLGRVNSAFWTASAGLFPLGTLLGGLVTETAGLRATFAVASLVAASGLLAVHALPTTDHE